MPKKRVKIRRQENDLFAKKGDELEGMKKGRAELEKIE